MYRPPENSNRVKAIKSKFENNSNDSKIIQKAPLRKSKTLQDFNVRPSANANINITSTKEQKVSLNSHGIGNKVNTQTVQPSLSRQLSDPAKRNIKRTPAFRLDRNNVLSEKAPDQKNARLLQNKSRYLDGKISKFDNSLQNGSDEKNINFKERLSRTKPNGVGHAKLIDKPKSNFTDLRNKFNGENQTPAACEISKPSENDDIIQKNQTIDNGNGTDASNVLPRSVLKFLYSEPLPKSQRNKPDNVYANTPVLTEDVHNNSTSLKLSESDTNNDKLDNCRNNNESCYITKNSKRNDRVLTDDVHNSATLKLSESHTNQNKLDNCRSDDESRYTTKNFKRNNPAYGSLRTKKSLEDLSTKPGETSSLTDTLKNALKKPLPKGPAPKKPPRTFLHSPVKPESPSEVAQLNLDKGFTRKLNTELQKNITSVKKTKGDPKYMLDKLETALKSKKILLRRAGKAENTSEEDSDNERSKLKFFNLRDLPSIPLTSSSQTLPNLPYTSPATSPKFNFNCLTSLGCVASAYEAVKEPNSSFFVKHKKEEPVYAEPFEYLVEEDLVNDDHETEGAIEATEATTSTKTIRRSLHYASSPVPDVKSGESNNHVSEVKSQDQITGSSESTVPSSTSTSDMDSIVSTPSEENKTLIPGIKVRDLIKAIENGGSSKNSHSPVTKTNSSPGAVKIKQNSINNHSDDRIKKLETQLKNTLERSFSTDDASPIANAHSESNISETDLTEEDSENKLETAKFETYVKRVRSKIYSRSRRRKEHLFHCCLLVALNRCTPYVKSKFPLNVQEPYKIAELCFPEVENGPMDSSVEAQCYSLIITNEHGERTFGYCRRVLPEASTACLPLAYCILSKHRAPGFYRKVLEELECRHGYPDKFRDAFIEELYNCKFPQPGETMIIDCSHIVSTAGCDNVRISKAVPSENENSDRVYDYSTNKSGHDINLTKLNCDTKDIVDAYNDNINERTYKTSENNGDEANELDLKSFVIVCNNGEYGTLMRGNNGTKNGVNVARGASTIINIAHEIPPTSLRRSTSSPSLMAEIESLPSELVLMRPQDSRHEENDLKLLGETLKTPVLQQVFCSLLLERKIIFVSCVLSKLSSCIEALQIILYPFSWQHTIIPVLPRSLWEIVDTPTPLVCGVLSAEVVNDFKIENAIVVDLDEGAVLLQVGDEDRILPCCLTQTLKDGLSLANKITSNKIGAHNVFFSDAFLRVFIQSCGHYKEFIVEGEFQKNEFIQHSRQKGKRIRQFLKWFTETTMFYNFVEVALNDSSSLDLLDQRIKIYSSESATEILNKMKYWTNYKSFLSTNLHRFQ